MIPFIRSLTELMAITQSKSEIMKSSKSNDFNNITEDSGQRKRYIRSKEEKAIKLPDLPKTTRHKWKKSKEVVTSIVDELDYNNQIQSSYDLTLLERQKNYDYQDVA